MIWAKNIKAITLFSRDLNESKKFYLEFLGGEPVFEDQDCVVFKIGKFIVNLLRHEAVAELLAPEKMSPEGIRAVYTIEVASVDDVLLEVRSRGINILNGPMDRPWGIRTASIVDPSGHVWELSNNL